MAKNSYHVIAKSDGKWSVKKTGAARASRNFSTKSEAIRVAANTLKRSGGGELIVHGKDGTVRSRDSYGNDPIPPKG